MDQLNTTLSILIPKSVNGTNSEGFGLSESLGMTAGDAQDQDSLDAALAFASALLTATEGNVLPTTGNLLPDDMVVGGSQDALFEETIELPQFAEIPVVDDELAASPRLATVIGHTERIDTLDAMTTGMAPVKAPTADVSPDSVAEVDSTVLTVLNSNAGLLNSANRGLVSPQTDAEFSAIPIGVPEDIIDQVRTVLRTDASRDGRVFPTPDRPNNAGDVMPSVKAPMTGEVSDLRLPLRADNSPLSVPGPIQSPAMTGLISRSNQQGRVAAIDTLRRVSLPMERPTEALMQVLPAAIASGGAATVSAQSSVSVAPTVVVESVVSEQGWSREFSEKVGWVINARLPSAQIKLNPEHLGPVELQVEVEDKQARIQFSALHGLTREAIEQSIPRLREALEQQGLSLTEADVSGFSQQGSSARNESSTDRDDVKLSSVDGDGEPIEADSTPDTAISIRQGLIDTFV
ncbi:MAG: flagellar hook-length control protein FliK [Woeseiaceae bacterium]